MKSRGSSHEVLYWRVALGLVGLLAPALIPTFAPRFPWQMLSVVLPVVGFFTAGFFAKARYRLTRKMRQARERQLWSTIWRQHPDCRSRSEGRDTSDQ